MPWQCSPRLSIAFSPFYKTLLRGVFSKLRRPSLPPSFGRAPTGRARCHETVSSRWIRWMLPLWQSILKASGGSHMTPDAALFHWEIWNAHFSPDLWCRGHDPDCCVAWAWTVSSGQSGFWGRYQADFKWNLDSGDLKWAAGAADVSGTTLGIIKGSVQANDKSYIFLIYYDWYPAVQMVCFIPACTSIAFSTNLIFKCNVIWDH